MKVPNKLQSMRTASMGLLVIIILCLAGCQPSASAVTQQTETTTTEDGSTSVSAQTAASDPVQTEVESHAHADAADATEIGHRPELAQESPIALDPGRGKEIGSVYEAFLSPHQEGGEEENTPNLTPSVFRSTAPSVPRAERLSHGHGVLAFTRDLSKAFVYVAIAEVNPEDIVMFHIHCGRPGQLGPILIDFALAGNLQEYWADGALTLELTNEDIEAVTNHGEGLIGAFTAGCPIVATIPTDKVKTIGGMEYIARQGDLYFNLHTKGQTFFGDIRGQLYRVEP